MQESSPQNKKDRPMSNLDVVIGRRVKEDVRSTTPSAVSLDFDRNGVNYQMRFILRSDGKVVVDPDSPSSSMFFSQLNSVEKDVVYRKACEFMDQATTPKVTE